MEIRFITDEFAIGDQPDLSDLAALRQAGVAALICNRPDGETAGQPAFGDVAAAALAHGMQARHLPVLPDQVTAAHGQQFAALLAELPKPVFAYCRTGRRAETLWVLAQSAG